MLKLCRFSCMIGKVLIENPIRGHSSVGRALHWQCRGHGFESHRLHFIKSLEIIGFQGFLFVEIITLFRKQGKPLKKPCFWVFPWGTFLYFSDRRQLFELKRKPFWTDIVLRYRQGLAVLMPDKDGVCPLPRLFPRPFWRR